ncbi:uncharacterized protein MELLADRAFT_113981 [Melampsora larici-populina 98AG31]|uniref:NAD-dependent epimerase/dehydratase domain-containing protein n=1 Tax=Melampsora larici-populina (strain 98AG31 / pathotype 3-4-7) TaxID=747676 RepID=F4SBR0_MELLP|nr:uncharacterized protein MELLADRAFT_113981 [Melampsora larici-populina 98AG31]EGF97924.1 hypothetical protein MELLADRAFT_113981 [Melampsora larici-populina 98AG31]
MPAIEPSSHVLVNGASGYIASWTCQYLLEAGHKVRGMPHGFDEAVKDIVGICHVASPFQVTVKDPYKDFINPAVNGTLSILKSAEREGKDVKRIVITSSFASVVNPTDDLNHIFDETQWNEYSPKLAEKAAWDYLEENDPDFDLVTLCPPYVLGPIIHQVNNANSLNASVKLFHDYLVGTSDAESAKKPMASEVDVRDLANAHLQSLLIEKAGGNRYAVSKQVITWQDGLDIIQEKGQGKEWPNATKGEPGSGKFVKQNVYDASKSIQDLDMKYRSFEDTVIDMSHSLQVLSKAW